MSIKMTSITWAGPRCVQELGTFLAPQNRIQGRCVYQELEGSVENVPRRPRLPRVASRAGGCSSWRAGPSWPRWPPGCGRWSRRACTRPPCSGSGSATPRRPGRAAGWRTARARPSPSATGWTPSPTTPGTRRCAPPCSQAGGDPEHLDSDDSTVNVQLFFQRLRAERVWLV